MGAEPSISPSLCSIPVVSVQLLIVCLTASALSLHVGARGVPQHHLFGSLTLIEVVFSVIHHPADKSL